MDDSDWGKPWLDDYTKGLLVGAILTGIEAYFILFKLGCGF